MAGMPHYVEKHPLFVQVGDLLNDSQNAFSRRAQLFAALSNPNAVPGSWFAGQSGTGGSPQATHIAVDWFGAAPDPGVVTPKKPNLPTGWVAMDAELSDNVRENDKKYRFDDSTGWWVAWAGDAAGIMRVAVLEALVASVGQPGNTASFPVAPTGTLLPIHFRWICGAAWFHVVVDTTDVQTTVLVMTPGAASEMPNPVLTGGGAATNRFVTVGARANRPLKNNASGPDDAIVSVGQIQVERLP